MRDRGRPDGRDDLAPLPFHHRARQRADFFLEPDHPSDWPEHWSSAGFSPLATYTSAVTRQLDVDHAYTSDALARLSSAGISIREFDSAQPDAELRRIHRLATMSFSRNLLQSSFRRRVPRRQSRLAADPAPGAGPAGGA